MSHISVSLRRVLLLGGTALWCIVVGIVVSATLRRAGLVASTATVVGGIVTVSLLAVVLLQVRRVLGPYSASAASQWDLAVLSAAPAALAAGVIWIVMFDGGPVAAAAIASGVFVALARWHRGRFAKEMRKQLRRPMRLDDIDQAERMIRDCREALTERHLVGTQRTAVELNLAHALTERSALSGRDDGLPEAVRLIESVLDQPAADVALLLYAASNLVNAMDQKAERSGDLTGYEDAVDLQMRIAERGSLSAGLPRALVDRAEYLLLRMVRAGHESDVARFEEYREAAVADLRRAVEATPTRSVMHLELVSKLALFDSLWSGGLSDLEEAIGQCRRALRLARHHPFGARVIGYETMSWLLVERAERDVSRRAADLAEAERLCRKMLARGGELAALVASEHLARILSLKDPGAARTRTKRGGREVTGPGAAYRDAFARQSRVSLAGASRVAEAWAGWATRVDDAEEAAEAHRCWLAALVHESKRRFLRVETERRLSRVQGLAAVAGRWLLAAGRVRDAALALELGRALLLTEVMGRDRLDLGRRLRNAGLHDLYERWRDVSGRMAQADRAEHNLGPSAGQLHATVSAQATPFIAPEHEALAGYEALLREIGRQPGFEDVDVDASLGYDDLGRIASADGPLIYVAAAEPHGFAVIVTEARDPLVVHLPALTAAALHERVTDLLESPVEWWRGELVEVLDWLYEAVIAKLGDHLPPRALVTLVPLGGLGLLPLHAAGATSDADGVWRDRLDGVAFRYAPNARALDRARATASSLARTTISVLTVDVGRAPGVHRLPYAAIESRAVEAQFVDGVVRRLPNGRRGQVLAALERCTVWHFACHGRDVPDDPLESALLLADHPITLRDLLARPAGRHRLAVLSACETALPDRALLDEVVGLPAALLQAGVAGVVATQAKVDDRAAMLLVQRFFERSGDGIAPARALAEAQTWLRTSTNARLHAHLPEHCPLPVEMSTAELEEWKSEYPFAHPAAWAPFSYTGA